MIVNGIKRFGIGCKVNVVRLYAPGLCITVQPGMTSANIEQLRHVFKLVQKIELQLEPSKTYVVHIHNDKGAGYKGWTNLVEGLVITLCNNATIESEIYFPMYMHLHKELDLSLI